MNYEENVKQAIIEANIILNDWTTSGKSQSKIEFDLNGMLKSVFIKNLKSDYQTNSVIANSIKFEGILTVSNILRGITVLFTHHYRASEGIYDNIRQAVLKMNFNELALKFKDYKPVKELEEIEFKSIEEIVF